MSTKLAMVIVALLALQASAQTIKNCNTNTDCTNFDGSGQISCCYTLTGTSISTG